ncbi:MAG: SDR family NAD(P)-dependent oxidoreductase [Lachnospiraceae bacterium]|nr:SDR family NAD(P)-dependent oxidoreductase [Lachnospiraceae bacterium]
MKNIAIITGASSGIGREFVKTLKDHMNVEEVWVIARSEDKLRALQEETPIPVRPVPLDLSDPAFIGKMESLLATEKPDVRLLINASGYGKFDAVEKLSMEDDLGMIDLNCRALAAMTKLALPYMHSGAKVIEIASVAAFQPIPYINVYGASKAFVLSFSRALNRELKKRGIHVMALCPFWTKTASLTVQCGKMKTLSSRNMSRCTTRPSSWTAPGRRFPAEKTTSFRDSRPKRRSPWSSSCPTASL